MGRGDGDEAYVLALCDEVLGEQGSRRHRFDWLFGDAGASGRWVRLSVDSFWAGRGLVVEYREVQAFANICAVAKARPARCVFRQAAS
jgi:hypothetical protein